MRFPRNGSAAANAFLVFAGALLGTTLTWWMAPSGSPALVATTHANATKRTIRDVSGIPVVTEKASESAESMSGAERAEGFREAGAAAARKSIKDALAEAAAITSRQDELEFYRGLYGVWAAQDPLAALDYAKANFQAGQLLSDSVGIAMNKWADENPREAWLWADQNLTGPLKDRALTDLMIGWSRRSPEQAATWLTGTGLTSQPLYNAVAGTWAETDTPGASKWARSLHDGHAKDTAIVAVAGAGAAKDPKSTANDFSDLIDKGDNLNLAIAITDIWATTDPAGTAEWVNKMPDGPSKNEAAATLATVWAASDITAAVAWSETIADDDTRRQVIAHIGTTWGAIEPVAALDWLTHLPAGQATEGVTGALYSWAGTDPVGMQEWIDSAGDGSLADRARRSLGDVLAQTNQPDAMAVALDMTSEVARNETLSRYFSEWRKTDDEAAQDWLQTNWSSLPATAPKQLAAVQAKPVIKR